MKRKKQSDSHQSGKINSINQTRPVRNSELFSTFLQLRVLNLAVASIVNKYFIEFFANSIYIMFFSPRGGTVAQSVEHPSKVPVWCNSTDMSSNHGIGVRKKS